MTDSTTQAANIQKGLDLIAEVTSSCKYALSIPLYDEKVYVVAVPQSFLSGYMSDGEKVSILNFAESPTKGILFNHQGAQDAAEMINALPEVKAFLIDPEMKFEPKHVHDACLETIEKGTVFNATLRAELAKLVN